MDLVEVKVLQGEVVALQQAGDRVGRGHQQAVRGHAVATVDEVHGSDLRVDQVSLNRDVVLCCPFLRGDQDGGSTVGQRGGVTGGHGGLGAVLLGILLAEDRLQLGQLLHVGVRAQVGIALHAQERGDEILKEALVVGLGQLLVRLGCQLVLLLAAQAELAGGDGRVVAHGKPGAGLAVARLLRGQLGRTDLADQLQAVGGGLCVVQLDQGLAQLIVNGQRCVGGGVYAAADAGLDATQGDSVCNLHQGSQAGAAGHLQVKSRGGGGQCGTDNGLAGQVEVAGVLQDGAGDDLAQFFALQTVASHQTIDGSGQHVLVRRIRVFLVGTGERDAVAAENGDLAGCSVSHSFCVTPSKNVN